MYLRAGEPGPSHSDGMRVRPDPFEAGRLRSERVLELRRRVAADVYRSADVVDEIARRILCSRDL